MRRLRTRSHRLIAALGATSLLTGCSSGVVGDWQSTKPVQGGTELNELIVDAGGTADATLWINRTVQGEATTQSYTFSATWDERREDVSYAFEMTCVTSPYGECEEEVLNEDGSVDTASDSFRMTCDLGGEDDQLSCAGEMQTNWSGYEFAWRKAE